VWPIATLFAATKAEKAIGFPLQLEAFGFYCSSEVFSHGRSGIPVAQRKDIAEHGNKL